MFPSLCNGQPSASQKRMRRLGWMHPQKSRISRSRCAWVPEARAAEMSPRRATLMMLVQLSEPAHVTDEELEQLVVLKKSSIRKFVRGIKTSAPERCEWALARIDKEYGWLFDAGRNNEDVSRVALNDLPILQCVRSYISKHLRAAADHEKVGCGLRLKELYQFGIKHHAELLCGQGLEVIRARAAP